ncbi:MAG: DNA (cytosine-5-)-methyltransferase, partial [Acinetobacter sp.]
MNIAERDFKNFLLDRNRSIIYNSQRLIHESESMSQEIKVAELFAGVGGFRLGLEGLPEWGVPKGAFKVVWANQWEPPGTATKQFAYRCYTERFDPNGNHPEEYSNQDIAEVMDALESATMQIPDFDMLVGGFPCQDYSVARPLSQSNGLDGKKGILWWSIYRMLDLKRPKYVLLENVDRLLKSPASQRGRDFAIILSCMNKLGYSVEWRVVNAADYGFPQRRRRIYIYGELEAKPWDKKERLQSSGVMAKALPIKPIIDAFSKIKVSSAPEVLTKKFGVGDKISKFKTAGVMQDGLAITAKIEPDYNGTFTTLGDILIDDSKVPDEFFIPEEKLPAWEYLKGKKKEERTAKTGHTYFYSEGGMTFPEDLSKPSRTILTGEGGAGASRFKHVIKTNSGRYRRLMPDELDQLQMFPKGWTDTKSVDPTMTDGRRAFCMGNALVVGVVQQIGKEIAKQH